MQRISSLDRLSILAYLTLAGVTTAGLWQIERILLRWLALGAFIMGTAVGNPLMHDKSSNSRAGRHHGSKRVIPPTPSKCLS